MKFDNEEVFNIENAIRGMRNPLNSWDKSDSGFGCCAPTNFCDFVLCKDCDYCEHDTADCCAINGYYQIGKDDLELAKKLLKSSEQRKFLRQIFVSVDITAPLYWWKEMDTYKVGTTANSTSTMHKLATTPITMDCFETGDYVHLELDSIFNETDIVRFLEQMRQEYLLTKDKRYWKELIRWLPESWLQTRTWTADYEVLRRIFEQRKNHKLTEWGTFCEWIKTLPYAQELICLENDDGR